MKTALALLCLSLVAGVFAAVPAPTNEELPATLAALGLPVAPIDMLAVEEHSHCAPSLGSCGSLSYMTCDCDVPTIIGTCFDTNGRDWFIEDCGHPVDVCWTGINCAPH